MRAEMRIDEAKGDSEKRKTNADASLQALKLSLVVSTSRQIEIENVLSVETNF